MEMMKKNQQNENVSGEISTITKASGTTVAPIVRPKGKARKIVLITLVAVALIVGLWIYADYLDQRNYFSTDNAKVTAKMYTINPVASGKLLEWNIKEGDKVNQYQVLGRQEVIPYITSPITGTVIKSNAVAGQMVGPAGQLAIIADTDNLYIGVNIEETDIARIKIGQTVDVKIDAFPGKTFNGQITEIDQTTQTFFSATSSFSTSGTYTKVTQLVPVKVVIENKDHSPLTFGMNATVKIHTSAATNTPIVTDAENNVDDEIQVSTVNSYTSTIEALDLMTVTPNVSGRVATVAATIGQPVKAGDTLFTIDNTDLLLQFNQVNATLVPAQVAYQDAIANATRMQKLFDAGAVSKVERDSAKSRADVAKGQFEASKAAVAIAQKKLDDCVIKAPIDGDVSQKMISVGSMAAPTAPAINLINTKDFLVHVNITETELGLVKIGNKANIAVQSIGVQTSGTVTYIAPACDAKTGLFPVEIRISNTNGQLRVGMMADVKLQQEP
ncbi:MAG: efflux RND transporter periplasmic adaptor subunit [Eubacteriales bacterium]|nr:efflux RND transporter periplasmic adaptor subunit [Eubacteriales bacterium]